ncbi:DUF3322 domain-containing protein [Diaphorobacter aerolatus]|uniref:DUF3322 and DUF2220 domain-containing protein n=1 Tax=Diaphorobacter aerolatus TaxID=1288495 RepID=A0A7H0GGJ1_9BURK|nr:DUF3322 domain-containing protein [Diaphorobacter aerolatus]QNP47407.1 hypothetical protein H9K75_13940 [Diaphorobacter aerolatus]
MKSPAQIAMQLARQWRNADLRERRLLQGGEEWPIEQSIGFPDSAEFAGMTPRLRQHIADWRAVSEGGPGRVQWAQRKYRAGAAPVDLPVKWLLDKPSDWLAAAQDAEMQKQYAFLRETLAQIDPCLHRLVVRRTALTQGLSPQELILATRVAMLLTPGCAEGRPLRALALAGNDSKFIERHETLLKALLDERFDGEATRQGLHAFLGALHATEHWLLVVPLAQGLLPFPRLRLAASDLIHTALPATHILVIENEQALHMLPSKVADTIAILGAGLNLEWLAAPWLRDRQVSYWGDLDTWGLYMLGRARSCVPGLRAIMMDDLTFDAHAPQAVPEIVHAPICQRACWILKRRFSSASRRASAAALSKSS